MFAQSGIKIDTIGNIKCKYEIYVVITVRIIKIFF